MLDAIRKYIYIYLIMFSLKTESSILNYSDWLVLGISVLFVGGAVFAYSYFTNSAPGAANDAPDPLNGEGVVDSATQTTVSTIDSATQTIVTAFNPDNIVQNTDYFKTALISDINVAKASDALRAPLEKVSLTNNIFADSSHPSPLNGTGAIEITLSHSSLAIPIPDSTALPIPANTVIGIND